jgi:hypothetical protein
MSVVRWVAASSWGTVPSFLQAASARRGRVARDPRDPRALRFVYLVTAEPADSWSPTTRRITVFPTNLATSHPAEAARSAASRRGIESGPVNTTTSPASGPSGSPARVTGVHDELPAMGLVERTTQSPTLRPDSARARSRTSPVAPGRAPGHQPPRRLSGALIELDRSVIPVVPKSASERRDGSGSRGHGFVDAGGLPNLTNQVRGRRSSRVHRCSGPGARKRHMVNGATIPAQTARSWVGEEGALSA